MPQTLQNKIIETQRLLIKAFHRFDRILEKENSSPCIDLQSRIKVTNLK
jgi:hypothetical protein